MFIETSKFAEYPPVLFIEASCTESLVFVFFFFTLDILWKYIGKNWING